MLSRILPKRGKNNINILTFKINILPQRSSNIPTEMFTVMFTLPRLAGWLSHWNEFVEDPDNKIVRPRQIYKGHERRDF